MKTYNLKYFLKLSKPLKTTKINYHIKKEIIEFKFDKPDCKDCKYLIKSQDNETTFCKKFRYSFAPLHNDVGYYIDTDLCRIDSSLCGPNATYFSKIVPIP